MSLWFFISHASADENQAAPSFVQTFYNSVVDAVRAQVHESGELGFLAAVQVKVGTEWNAELAKAIGRCQCFIPLMTARYFTREMCGREWGGFEARCKASTHADTRGRILPVVWGRPPRDGFPDFALDHHYFPSADAISDGAERAMDEYRKFGLLHLLKRIENSRPHALAYQDFVDHLAAQIVRVGSTQPLPEASTSELTTLTHAPMKFPCADGRREQAATGSDSKESVGAAHFAILAGRLDEMTRTRSRAEAFYATESRSWRPFGAEHAAFRIVQEVSVVQDVICDWLDGRQPLAKRIRELETAPQPVVVIVDSWSTHIREFSDTLSELDRHRFENCVILVVWDIAAATPEQREDLQMKVRGCLGRWSSSGPSAFYDDRITSIGDLRAAVENAIGALQCRLVQRAQPNRTAGDSRYSVPPRVG